VSPITNNFNAPTHGNFYQAERDIIVVSSTDALVAARRLRAALADDREPASRAAVRDLDEIESALASPRPDRERIARRLESLTRTLKAGGALASAGAALVGPIGVVAGFLGPLGEAVTKLLQG